MRDGRLGVMAARTCWAVAFDAAGVTTRAPSGIRAPPAPMGPPRWVRLLIAIAVSRHFTIGRLT
jgi:hypothetical protein